MNPDEFLNKLSEHGFNVTADYIRKLVQKDLLPIPERKRLGKGKGMTTAWSEEMLYQTIALLRLNREQKIKINDIGEIRQIALKANVSPGRGYELLESAGYDEAFKNKMALTYLLYMESARLELTPDIPVVLKYEVAKDKKGDYIRQDGVIKVKNRIVDEKSDADIVRAKKLAEELRIIEERYRQKGAIEEELRELKATVS